MTLVALISAYKEGPLVDGAIRSAMAATENIVVLEGPAGDPLDAQVPESDYEQWGDLIRLKRGRWSTDAKKRTAMIEACRNQYEPPVWGVWIDGDEILCNGEYLPDWLNSIQWQDDCGDPDAPPSMGWPMKLVELDGSVVVCRGKVVRIDLIDSYSVSSSVFRNALGFLHGEGNYAYSVSGHVRPFSEWIESEKDAQKRDAMADQLRLWPPFPCEPHLLHRSALRHPLRRGLRLHEQEASELEKAKLSAEKRDLDSLRQKPGLAHDLD
jgi:hypothetical protein